MLIGLIFAISNVSATPAPLIPMVEGLTVTTAIAEPNGDYESRKRLLERENDYWRLAYSADIPAANRPSETIQSERIVHDADLQTARAYRNYFESDVEEDYPGTTALGASALVIQELRESGRSRYALVAEHAFLKRAITDLPERSDALLSLASALTASAGISFKGELTRRALGSMNVLINDQIQSLPVIVAAGRFTAKNGQSMAAELSFLNDDNNPIALQWQIGETQLRVVRIDFPVLKGQLAETLKTEKRVALPGLYFDFGSAQLRPESASALPAIAEAIRAAPSGLMLEGHTDNIGNAASNQKLSLARAKAVWTALLALDPTLGPKPAILGFGASRPLASNETLSGRAQNRRVMLAIP